MGRDRNKDTVPLVLNEQTFPVIEQIASGMPGGFFIYHADGDGSIIYANQALLLMYGCQTLEEFKAHTGYTFKGLVHPDDWERVSKSISGQIRTRHGFDYVEYQIVRKDGAVRWIEDYGHFVKTETFGDVFYVFVDDATERHQKEQLAREKLQAMEQLERETTALRIVHEILLSGMWSMEFDQNGRMVSVHWSDEFRRMLGYQDETDFPNTLEAWANLIHPEDKERVLEDYYNTVNDYTGNKVYDVEYQLLTKDRGYCWFRHLGKLSRRTDGTPISYVGVFVETTKKRELDQALKEQRALLEEALSQAQRSNQAKTTFLNNMSHDIRTPMNAIVGFTTLASSHINNTELVKVYLSKILASSSHLLSLINDVLDMSRIESGKIHIQKMECSLREIMEGLQERVQLEADSKQIQLSVDVGDLADKYVICDKLRLTQVLLNVVGNALKFTPVGGSVSVSVREKHNAPEGYASYVFQVRDNGIGMDRKFLPHIFEPFERERTSTISGIQGTGLGMAITKNLVDMMKGVITVDSELGKGTQVTLSFTFRLSGRQNKPEGNGDKSGTDASPDEIPENYFQGKRILLAEDNELNQEIAATILSEAGFEVDVAADGAAAVEKVKQSPPDRYDLILMDIQMPVMDGYEAARQIKSLGDPRLAEIPIIAMTANSFDGDRKQALDTGMSGYLGKPIEIDKLIAVLKRLLT